MSDIIVIDQSKTGVTTLRLNRPEVHNAFDDVLINELTTTLERIGEDKQTRVVVIASSGKSFCAGADLNWMRRAADYSDDENYDDAMRLGAMLQTLDQLPRPTIAAVHGPTYGGGVGLVSCCDIAIATDASMFSLSEVKLGIIPAMISPYVVRAMGGRAARRYFQSGERFDGEEALRIGLVHQLVAAAELPAAVEAQAKRLLECGPHAQGAAKKLVRDVEFTPVDDTLLQHTAHRIAAVRASPEGKEGLNAFLQKRKAAWRDD